MRSTAVSVPPNLVRVAQIIVLSLMMSSFIVGGVVIFRQAAQAPRVAPALPILSIASIAAGLSLFAASALLPSLITNSLLKQIASGKPLQEWATAKGDVLGALPEPEASLLRVRMLSCVVSVAMLEAAALLGCLAYSLEGQWYSFVVPGIAIVWMAFRIPTLSEWQSWLDWQRETLDMRRLEAARE